MGAPLASVLSGLEVTRCLSQISLHNDTPCRLHVKPQHVICLVVVSRPTWAKRASSTDIRAVGVACLCKVGPGGCPTRIASLPACQSRKGAEAWIPSLTSEWRGQLLPHSAPRLRRSRRRTIFLRREGQTRHPAPSQARTSPGRGARRGRSRQQAAASVEQPIEPAHRAAAQARNGICRNPHVHPGTGTSHAIQATTKPNRSAVRSLESSSAMSWTMASQGSWHACAESINSPDGVVAEIFRVWVASSRSIDFFDSLNHGCIQAVSL